MNGERTKRARTERALEMHQLYARGATLEAVGRRYEVSRERVRQIFRDAGLPTIPLAERRRRVAQERAEEIVEKFSELGDQRVVAETLGLPLGTVDEVLRQHMPAATLRKPRRHAKKYSNDELVWMLREARGAVGGVLSKHEYESYARGRVLDDGRPWPTGQTHMLRFGSWRKSLEAAGLRANPSSPIGGQLLFNESHCIDAVRHVARELGKVPTVAEYERYASESNGGLPSAATVRNRCGRWYETLGKAGL